jgi:hypothetical protein
VERAHQQVHRDHFVEQRCVRGTAGRAVLEPMACAINLAIAAVRLGVSHSKRCYEILPQRETAEGSINIPR